MEVKYVPADITLLNEGELLSEVQREFEEAKDALLSHVAIHDQRIKKARAVVTVEIEIAAENCDGAWMFGVRTQVQHKRPKPPARGSKLLRMVGEGGEIGLFVQPSGSTEDSPRQGRFAKTDGTGLDPATGEPSEKRTLKIGKAGVA